MSGIIYPVAIQPYAAYITMILGFVDGLLFGLAVKKAVISVVLVIVGLIVASFLGLTFLPNVTSSQFYSAVSSFFTHLNFGAFTVTFSIVLFAIGFGIGIWKG